MRQDSFAGWIVLLPSIALSLFLLSPPAAPQSYLQQGATAPTSDMDANGHKVTNLSPAATPGDALSYGQSAAQLAGLSTTVYADQMTGADFSVKINNALASCPASGFCTIDGTALTGGTASASIVISRSNTFLHLGAATYEFPSGKALQIKTSGSSPPVETDDVSIAGSGKNKTIVQFDAAGTGSANNIGILGSFYLNGSVGFYLVGSSVTAGGTTFTANPSDLTSSSLAAGDQLIMGTVQCVTAGCTSDNVWDYKDIEGIVTVASVVGTTVTVTKAFRYSLTHGAARWSKIVPVRNVTVEDMTVQGVSVLLVENEGPTSDVFVQRVRFSASSNANSMVYANNERPVYRDDEFINTSSGNMSAIETDYTLDGLIDHNIFRCAASATGLGIAANATAGLVITNNTLSCSIAQISTDLGTRDARVSNNLLRAAPTWPLANQTRLIVVEGFDNYFSGNAIVNSTATTIQVGGTPLSNWAASQAYMAGSCVFTPTINSDYFCTKDGGTSYTASPTGSTIPCANYDGTVSGCSVTEMHPSNVTWYDSGPYITESGNLFLGTRIENTSGYYVGLFGTSSNNEVLDVITPGYTFTFTDSGAQNLISWIDANGILHASKSVGGLEGGAPSGIGGTDLLWADSSAHRWKMINNNGTATNVVGASDSLSALSAPTANIPMGSHKLTGLTTPTAGTDSSSWAPPKTAIGSLPSCASAQEGATAVATDCNVPCAADGSCTTGGSTHCQMYCNGSAWIETGQ